MFDDLPELASTTVFAAWLTKKTREPFDRRRAERWADRAAASTPGLVVRAGKGKHRRISRERVELHFGLIARERYGYPEAAE